MSKSFAIRGKAGLVMERLRFPRRARKEAWRRIPICGPLTWEIEFYSK
jgi:hypothetical protein